MKHKMFVDLKSCYHGAICHSKAEDILLGKGLEKGAFLVWKIDENQGDYVISVKETDLSCIHYLITCPNDGEFFKTTLGEVLRYYRTNPLDDSTRGLRLASPVKRIDQEKQMTKRVICTADYSSQHCSHLSFQKGEILHLLDCDDPNWWYAHNGSEIGFIPSSCVRLADDGCSTTDDRRSSLISFADVVDTDNTNISSSLSGKKEHSEMKDENENNSNNSRSGKYIVTKRRKSDVEKISLTKLSFIRCILENFKTLRISSSSTINSDLNSYRSYPIDDDIFCLNVVQPSQTKKTSSPRRSDVTGDSNSSVGSTTSEDDVISIDRGSDVICEAYRSRPMPTYLYDSDIHSHPFHPSVKIRPDSKLKGNNRRATTGSLIDPRPLSRDPRLRFSSVLEGQAPPEDDIWSLKTVSSDPISFNEKSYYVSVNDLSPGSGVGNPSESESFYKYFSNSSDDDLSTADSGVDNTFNASLKCFPVSVRQVCEVWGEVGPAGGVLQIPGSIVSLHISPNLSFNKKLYKRAFSTSSAQTYNSNYRQTRQMEKTRSQSDLMMPCSNLPVDKDGRIVLGLEDPPNSLNDRLQVVAGPMVRVDYANGDVMSAGVVLQIDVNVALKNTEERMITEGGLREHRSAAPDGFPMISSNFSCLQSDSPDGPFLPIDGSCYHYGNTLQVTLDTSSFRLQQETKAITGMGGRLFLVPTVQLAQNSRPNPFVSVWNGIAKKVFSIGFYGSKNLQLLSTCCVTMSSSAICPPTLWVTQQNNTQVLLHLWSSYHIHMEQIQDLHIALQSDHSSPLSVTSCRERGSIISEEEDIRRKSRIFRLFTLRYCKSDKKIDQSSPKSSSSGEETTKSPGFKQKNSLYVTLTGMRDGAMYQMHIPTPEPEPGLVSSTPIKRWKRVGPIEPPKTMLERKTAHIEEYLYLWYDAQKESKLKLRPAFEIPGADRRLTSARLAVALTSRIRGKGHSMLMPTLAQYSQSDVIPILGDDTLWAHGTTKYKEWYVGYSRRKIGLVHTKCIRLLDFEQYYNKYDVRLTVSDVIESILPPVAQLTFGYATMRQLLLDAVEDWMLFAAILRFGENYIEKVMNNAERESEKQTHDKISLFLEKYKEYCMTGPRRRSFHGEIIRALLYMERYDLVMALIADFCVLSVAVQVGQRWCELVNQLNGEKASEDELVKRNKKHRRNKSTEEGEKLSKDVIACHGENNNTELIEEATWRPAFDFISSWRRQFGENHRSALLHLHKSVDEMIDSPNKTWKAFTGTMILIYGMDTLKKYDTRL